MSVRVAPIACVSLVLATWGSGCAVPYPPASMTTLVELDDAAFERILAVVRADYPRLEVDRVGYRIRSDWIPFQEKDVPGRRRVSLWREQPNELGFVVEVQFVEHRPFANPNWGTVRGSRRGEHELRARLEAALDPEGPADPR